MIHFAGLKAVGESQQIPLKYFENNISGSISLVQAMKRAGVFYLVFSSSATVYGEFNPSPYQEDMPIGMPTNNYGYTKMVVEQLLEKTARANPQWSIALLRYFNPVGAHKSGQIGEDPQGIPNNLMPFVTQVAVGRRKSCQSLVMIIRLKMGHVSGISFMLSIWPKLMFWRFRTVCNKRVVVPGISVQESLFQCYKSRISSSK